MTEGWIRRESNFALQLFRWVNKIIEYLSVAIVLKRLGMKVIEEKKNRSVEIREISAII